MRRKRIYILSAVLILLLSADHLRSQVERKEQGNLITEGIPDIPHWIVERMSQYQDIRSASLVDWSPSGDGLFITTRLGETTQIYSVEKPGGDRKQLTFFSEPIEAVAVCPDSFRQGFLFSLDTGGGESYQIYYFSLQEGRYTMLTDSLSRNESMLWANRGDKFVYASTRRNGKDYDLYLSYVDKSEETKPILQEQGSWSPVDWSPEDQQLLVQKYVSVNESYYFILELTSGKLTPLNPNEGKISYGGAVWGKGGKGIFLTSDERSEFQVLRYYDLEKKKFTDLTAEIPWDVKEIEISKQRDKLAFITNQDGISRLYLLDTGTMKYTMAPVIPAGQLYGLKFHPDGKSLALVINTSQTPGDVYMLQLEDSSLVRWTFSETGGLDPEEFIMPELVHYQTFDSTNGKTRMIPAFYYKPDKSNPPYPVLIDIHGGPELQYLPYFSSLIQYLVKELNIAVLTPNVRGSAGYGKSYLFLDNGFKREDSVKDIGKLLDWIEKQPELDPSRVAVMGSSYGGYMVLSSMIHYNHRLTCGIERVGISNFVTFLENTKDYRRDLRRAEYGDEQDPKTREFLTSISPLTHAYNITKPMLIAQGLNDPRVPVSESEQIVSAIRKNGGTAWYFLAKDEGHGLSKKSNRDYYNYVVVLFLEKFLLSQKSE